MIAEGIVFDRPFDMSSYTRDDILERFGPFKDTRKWKRERIESSADKIPLNINKDTIIAEDMVIKRFSPDDLSVLANLYLTTGIFDVVCPKLCRVDMLDEGSMLLSYPYFPEDPEYSKKIENTVDELGRVSLFILEETGKENLEGWKKKIKNYVDTYISYVRREDFGDIGDKKIVKRIYKPVI